MAIRQKYRENSQQKQYEMIVDFSKGINTKEADSLLTDNVARKVNNFDIIAGGMLSKRVGFENIGEKDANGISKQTKDLFDLLNKKYSTEYTDINVDMSKLHIIKTLKFNDGNKSIIILITDKGDVFNTIIKGGKYFSTTMLSDTVYHPEKIKIETNGLNTLMFANHSEQITGAHNSYKEETLVYRWVGDNWLKLDVGTPSAETVAKQAKVTIDRLAKGRILKGSGIVLHPSSDNDANKFYTEASIVGTFAGHTHLGYTTTALQEDTSYTYTPKLDSETKVTINTHFKIQGIVDHYSQFGGQSTLIKNGYQLGSERINNAKYFMQLDQSDFEAMKTKLPSGMSIENLLKMILIGDPSVQINSHMEWNDGYQSVPGGGVPAIGNSVKIRTKILLKGHGTADVELFNFEEPVQFTKFGTSGLEKVGLVDDHSYTPYISCDLTINYNKQLRQGSAAHGMKVYKPNAFSMQYESYNILTLNSMDNPQLFNSADTNRMVFDNDKASFPEIDGIILLNGYFAKVDEPMNLKVSLSLRATDTRANWKFGYLFMPIEEWAVLERNVETEKDYITQIIKPSFERNAGQSSLITITPKTSGQYILMVFATEMKGGVTMDDAYWTGAKISNFMSRSKNISPAESVGMRQEASDVLIDFFKTDKSIVWDNKMFMYGGSNSFFVSSTNNFAYFPMLNSYQIPSNSKIESIAIYYDSLIVATNREQFVLTKNAKGALEIKDLNQDVGVVAHRTVKNNANYLFQLTEDGVYRVKSLFNFRDRYNVDKLDSAITGNIEVDYDACAVVYGNKYYLHTPKDNTIWIYYNEYNSWIKYTSTLFNLRDMFVVDNELFLISKEGGAIYRMKSFNSNLINNKGENEGYYDTDYLGVNYNITSIYKSKQIDFGLPNHDKAMKKLHVRFEETPGLSPVFLNGWVDSAQVITDRVDTLVQDPSGVLQYSNALVPQIKTIPQGDFQSSTRSTGSNFSIQDNDTRFVSDTDQLHEIVISGRGRQFQFEVRHEKPIKANIKNFGVILKTKKPKARRIRSTK